MKRILLFFCLLMASVTCVAKVDFNKATTLYQNRNFEEAANAFEALVAFGHIPSVFNLGVMHYKGQFFRQDIPRGVAMMMIAREHSDNPAFSQTVDSVLASLSADQMAEVNKQFKLLGKGLGIDRILSEIMPAAIDDAELDRGTEAVRSVRPIFPYIEHHRGRMGIVAVDINVSPEGYARDVVVDMSTSPTFTKAVLKALKANRYKPYDLESVVPGKAITFIFHLEHYPGVTMVKSARFKEENEMLHQAAEQGVARYQYLYGKRLLVIRQFEKYLKTNDVQFKHANDWFFKAAQQGYSAAQFELGLSLLRGRGCVKDEKTGMMWVQHAAQRGFAPAQRVLGQRALNRASRSGKEVEAGVEWLRSAVELGDTSSSVLLAWEYAVSELPKVRDADAALSLLEETVDNYFDDVRIQETYAAIYAVQAKYKRALKHQKKALKLAKKYGWKTTKLQERLAMYEHGQPYYGSYY